MCWAVRKLEQIRFVVWFRLYNALLKLGRLKLSQLSAINHSRNINESTLNQNSMENINFPFWFWIFSLLLEKWERNFLEDLKWFLDMNELATFSDFQFFSRFSFYHEVKGKEISLHPISVVDWNLNFRVTKLVVQVTSGFRLRLNSGARIFDVENFSGFCGKFVMKDINLLLRFKTN